LELVTVSIGRNVSNFTYLECHSDSSNHNSPEHWPAFKQTCESSSLELDIAPCVGPLQGGEVLLLGALLENTLRLDFQEFKFDERMLSGKVTKTGEDVPGLIFAIMVDEPTRRKRHEYNSDAKEHRWSKLQSERKKPSSIRLGFASASDVICAIVNPDNR
jgi:hypothetical protein